MVVIIKNYQVHSNCGKNNMLKGEDNLKYKVILKYLLKSYYNEELN